MAEENADKRFHEILAQEKFATSQLDLLKLISAYDEYLLSYPKNSAAYINRANLLQKVGFYQLALRDVEFVLKQDIHHSFAWCHRAFILLTLGNYQEGWRDFEWRLEGHIKDNIAKNWKTPRLNNENLLNKKLLILAEQGLGDNIQFIRYAIKAKELGIDVAVLNRKPLHKLLEYTLNKYGISSIQYGDTLYDVYRYAYMMSLPHYFKTTLDSIPYPEGYLSAEPQNIEKWKKRLNNQKSFKIGLVWAGSALHNRNAFRSISFERIKSLFQLNAEFHCLQKEVSNEDYEAGQGFSNLYFWHTQIDDFSDTAGLISQMDLVISIDTSVAHLSAAMAKPTWIMLTYNPDYRWLLKREDSPWYHAARLFRQDITMEWEVVIEKIKQTLQQQYDIPLCEKK